MDQQYVSRREYEEHNRRADDEHSRMNKRISLLEENAKVQTEILLSIERMGGNIETITKEQARQGKMMEKQGQEIEEIKDAPLKQMKNTRQALVNSVINVIVGAVLGVVLVTIFGIGG